MDHLAMLVVAGASIGAWCHAVFRRETPWVWKLAGLVVALPVIAIYFIIEAMRTRGMWVSGAAEAGWPVIVAMGLGFMAALGQMDGDAHERGRGA